MEAYSLYELNEYLRRVIALNFNEPIWIHAEVMQVGESRGNYYLELIEKKEDSNEVIAQSSAVIWYKTFLFLKSKFKKTIDSLLRSGVEVRVKVKIDYNERYGLKLVIEDIDPSYTLGQLELERQKIIEKLEAENLIAKNAELDLPIICQRIAVISSARAAGYQDFLQQLSENNYNYFYKIHLFSAAMQGAKTESEVSSALAEINELKEEFDCVIILRGGGSKLDLSAFDSYEICKSIANHSLPIITAIGHEIDQGVADIVSHTNLKTPTAAANFLIDHNLDFESELLSNYQEISQLVAHLLREEEQKLHLIELELSSQSSLAILSQKQNIENAEERLQELTGIRFKEQKQALENAESIIGLVDPAKVLERGYALIKQKGKLISNAKAIKLKQEIEIILKDARIEATVNKKS